MPSILCRRIGFAGQLIPTNDAERRAFVVRRGKLLPVPKGFALMAPSRPWPMLASPILSPLGKLRLAYERFVPPRRDTGDESLGDFARRRLGREVFERLVQPLVGGIYTADPERLSLAATLPRFQDMERCYGSLTREAAGRPRRGPRYACQRRRYGLFTTPSGVGIAGQCHCRQIARGLSPAKLPSHNTSKLRNRWQLAIAGNTSEQIVRRGRLGPASASRRATAHRGRPGTGN